MNYVFSICIPTFNRCQELKATLESIVRQDAFGDDIEVVVIDNASPDLTESVAREFAHKYPNIVYQRNPANIGATENTLKALSTGTGKYLKLLNDNKILNDGVIGAWAQLFSDADETVVFHYPHSKGHDQNSTRVVDADQFAYALGFYMTWLGGFAFKREALKRIDLEAIDRSTSLPQTEIMFKLLSAAGPARVVYSDWFTESQQPVRTGYNYFEVFTENFPRMLDEAQESGLISRRTKRHAQSQLLRYHTFPFMLNLVDSGLERDRAYRRLIRRFHSVPELYLLPFWAIWHRVQGRRIHRRT